MNPTKYLMKDLINKQVPFDVWLQGTLKRIVDKDVIISDSTGEVMISGCDDKNKILGAYCCVLGVAVKTNNLPVVKAAKFININSNHQKSWEMEVQEAQLLLNGLRGPKL